MKVAGGKHAPAGAPTGSTPPISPRPGRAHEPGLEEFESSAPSGAKAISGPRSGGCARCGLPTGYRQHLAPRDQASQSPDPSPKGLPRIPACASRRDRRTSDERVTDREGGDGGLVRSGGEKQFTRQGRDRVSSTGSFNHSTTSSGR